MKEAARKAAQHARDSGVDIAKLAIMDAVRDEDVPTSLVGCASREQVTRMLFDETTAQRALPAACHMSRSFT